MLPATRRGAVKLPPPWSKKCGTIETIPALRKVSSNGGPSEVGSPDAYRRYATECFQMASTVNDSRARAILLQMAQVWLRLANEKELTCKVVEAQPAVRS